MQEGSTQKQILEANKLAKRLRRQVGEAVADYNMIEAGDRVMVCLSGGKDSYGLLDILLSLKASAPVHFEVVALHLDQAHPGAFEITVVDDLTKAKEAIRSREAYGAVASGASGPRVLVASAALDPPAQQP